MDGELPLDAAGRCGLARRAEDCARPRPGKARLVGEQMRTFYGDGNYGGYYQRADEEMLALWDVAVAETRALIAEGWD